MPGRIDAIERRATAVASDLDEEQLRRRPSSGGWSVGELLGHLVTSFDAYARSMRAALGRPDLPRGNPADWSTGLAGGFILRTMVSRRRFPAPKVFRPKETPGVHSLPEFLRTTRELREFIDQSRGLDWNAIRLSSPVSSLIRIRLGEALAMQVVHAERHLGQAERVRAEIMQRQP